MSRPHRYVFQNVLFVSSASEEENNGVVLEKKKRRKPSNWFDRFKRVSPLKYLSTSEEEEEASQAEASKIGSATKASSKPLEKPQEKQKEETPDVSNESSIGAIGAQSSTLKPNRKQKLF